MSAPILPKANILTKTCTAAVSIMAKGCIVASALPLRCFLFLLLYYIHISAIIMQYYSYTDKREVLQQKFSQPPNTYLSSLPVGSLYSDNAGQDILYIQRLYTFPDLLLIPTCICISAYLDHPISRSQQEEVTAFTTHRK